MKLNREYFSFLISWPRKRSGKEAAVEVVGGEWRGVGKWAGRGEGGKSGSMSRIMSGSRSWNRGRSRNGNNRSGSWR